MKTKKKRQRYFKYQGREFSTKLRFDVFSRDNFTCQYCGKSAPEVSLEIDHVKPLALGGEDAYYNLITSCWACNSGKSDTRVEGKERHHLCDRDCSFDFTCSAVHLPDFWHWRLNPTARGLGIYWYDLFVDSNHRGKFIVAPDRILSIIFIMEFLDPAAIAEAMELSQQTFNIVGRGPILEDDLSKWEDFIRICLLAIEGGAL